MRPQFKNSHLFTSRGRVTYVRQFRCVFLGGTWRHLECLVLDVDQCVFVLGKPWLFVQVPCYFAGVSFHSWVICVLLRRKRGNFLGV